MNGVEGQFQPVGNTQLVEDVMQMVLHRLLTDEHPLGHFFIFEALCHEHDDLAFAMAESGALIANAEA